VVGLVNCSGMMSLSHLHCRKFPLRLWKGDEQRRCSRSLVEWRVSLKNVVGTQSPHLSSWPTSGLRNPRTGCMCIDGIKQPQREVIYDHTRCENVGRCDGNGPDRARRTSDSFLDETVHARAPGVNLTELGRLVLYERAQMKPHQ